MSFSKRADSPAAPRRVPTNRDASGRLKTRYEDPGAREALKQAAAGGGGTTDLWRRLRSLAHLSGFGPRADGVDDLESRQP